MVGSVEPFIHTPQKRNGTNVTEKDECAQSAGAQRPHCSLLTYRRVRSSHFAPLKQSRRFHPLGPFGERRRWASPAKCVDFLEEGCVGAQRREILEEQGEVPLLAKNFRREVFD